IIYPSGYIYSKYISFTGRQRFALDNTQVAVIPAIGSVTDKYNVAFAGKRLTSKFSSPVFLVEEFEVYGIHTYGFTPNYGHLILFIAYRSHTQCLWRIPSYMIGCV